MSEILIYINTYTCTHIYTYIELNVMKAVFKIDTFFFLSSNEDISCIHFPITETQNTQ